MNLEFFKKLYQHSVAIYQPLIAATKINNEPLRYDSTIVSLSSKLMKQGYVIKSGDAAHLRLIINSLVN